MTLLNNKLQYIGTRLKVKPMTKVDFYPTELKKLHIYLGVVPSSRP